MVTASIKGSIITFIAPGMSLRYGWYRDIKLYGKTNIKSNFGPIVITRVSTEYLANPSTMMETYLIFRYNKSHT